MENINGKLCCDIEEASKMLDNVILEQAEILRRNLKEKRNNSVKELEYV